MNRRVGIMQGRLSPPVPGRLQIFPWETWETEFEVARECGFCCIELLLHAERLTQNPLWTDPGRQRLKELSDKTDVGMFSACADYVTEYGLGVEHARENNEAILRDLIRNCGALGIACILIPLLGKSSIRERQPRGDARRLIDACLDDAHRHGVVLAVETDLDADECRAFVEEVDDDHLRVYFDMGNATAEGFDAADDVRVLGPWLAGVHVKDRPRGGPNVPLGEGDTDFDAVFEALDDVGYVGKFVLETVRGSDYVDDARRNLAFVEKCLDRAGSRR